MDLARRVYSRDLKAAARGGRGGSLRSPAMVAEAFPRRRRIAELERKAGWLTRLSRAGLLSLEFGAVALPRGDGHSRRHAADRVGLSGLGLSPRHRRVQPARLRGRFPSASAPSAS